MADSGYCSLSEASARRLGPGRVVLVVGPSGAGKDAIIGAVRERLAQDRRFLFPNRIVTREPSSAEKNETVSADEFELLARRGALALHWNAHGLRYGVPVAMDDAVRLGGTVVFNASRQAVPAAKVCYACVVAYIDAPPHIRAQRVASRGRERAEDIVARLERLVAGFDPGKADVTIDNSGSLAEASEHMVRWLLELAATPTHG